MVGVFLCAEQEHSEVCVTDLSGTSLCGHELISAFFPAGPLTPGRQFTTRGSHSLLHKK